MTPMLLVFLAWKCIVLCITRLFCDLSTAPQNAVEEDADESGDYNNNVANMCVLKPYRGVASDGVIWAF